MILMRFLLDHRNGIIGIAILLVFVGAMNKYHESNKYERIYRQHSTDITSKLPALRTRSLGLDESEFDELEQALVTSDFDQALSYLDQLIKADSLNTTLLFLPCNFVRKATELCAIY